MNDLTELLTRTTRDVRAPDDLLARAATRRRRHVVTRVAGGALAVLVAVGGVAVATQLVGADEADDVIITPVPPTEDAAPPEDDATADDDGGDDDPVDAADDAAEGTDGDSDDGADDPRSDLAPAGTILMADDEGVHLVGMTGPVVQLSDQPAERVYDDGAGGFLVEAPSEGEEFAPSPAILWRALEADGLVEVVPEGLSDGVELRDGGLVDGGPAAVFTVFEDGDGQPADFQESVQYRVLPDGDRQRVADPINSFEGGYSAAALGGDVVAAERFESAATSFEVLDLGDAGAQVDANPLADDACFDSVECPSGWTVSPDGERFAWLQRTLDGTDLTTVLVVAGRDGTSVVEVELPVGLVGEGVQVDGVDLGAEFAVVNRVEVGSGIEVTQWLPGLQVDLRNPDDGRDGADRVFELPRAGHASVGTAVR